jgi:hemolysin D
MKTAFKIYWQACREFFARYREVWSAAWQERHLMDANARTAQEAEFLPAALAIQETPVHPLPRVSACLLVGLIVLILIASVVFQTEIIVTAPGQLVVSGRAKSIQALESAVVREIAVREGDFVEAGDVLIELFSPGVNSDSARARAELSQAQSDVEHGQALLKLVGENISTAPVHGATWLDVRYREYQDKVNKLNAEIKRREVEIQTMQKMLRKLDDSLPTLRAKAQDYVELEQKGYVAKHAVLDQLQAISDTENDRHVQKSRVQEAQAQLAESQRTLATLRSEFRRSTMEQVREADLKQKVQAQELSKYTSRDGLMQLRAPISGHVQQLTVTTVGGVVSAAQILMNIVPIDDALEVEAILENKDIGRLHTGQSAQIKVDTFPFTRFGTVPAKLRLISADAIADDKKGPIYKARLLLESDHMGEGKNTSPLLAGMTVTVEVKVGQRRIITFFLDPLMRNITESGHEW